MAKIPEHRLTRVRLRNYRSIRSCDVELGALTCLVGPNGSGKSNFLDALRFVSEALREGLAEAVAERGGFDEMRSRWAPPGAATDIELDGRTPGERFRYELSLVPRDGGSYAIEREWCGVWPDGYPQDGDPQFQLKGDHGSDGSTELFLPDMRRFPSHVDGNAYDSVLGLLTGLDTFSVNPDAVRAPQRQLPGNRLLRDGANLALVLRELERTDEGRSVVRRIVDYLSLVVPDLVGVRRLAAGPWETLEFLVRRDTGTAEPWTFPALSVSDGTLRATGVLTALFGSGQPAPVGVEEPENALNPAASAILLEALRDASEHRQVIVTTHSPDLLDSHTLQAPDLRAVRRVDGHTVIDEVDEAARLALNEELFTAGELLRVDQLQPRSGAVE